MLMILDGAFCEVELYALHVKSMATQSACKLEVFFQGCMVHMFGNVTQFLTI